MVEDRIFTYWLYAVLFSVSCLFIAFMPDVGSLYYVIMATLLVYGVSKGGVQLNWKMAWFLIACALSLLLNSTPALFKGWMRLGLFVMVTGVLSPFLQNDFFNVLRIRLFSWLMWLLVATTVLSFFAYLLGIDLSTSREGEIIYFGGITNHSMLLGPVAGISFVYLFVRLLTKRYSVDRKLSFYLLIAGLMMSFITVLLTGSRGALISTLLSGVFVLFKYNRRNLIKFLLYLVLVFAVSAVSYSLWKPYTKAIERKQEGNMGAGGATASRAGKWKSRAKEFNSSPFWGIGFSAVSLESVEDYDMRSGVVETGTSWGGLLAMVGLFGIIPFLILFIGDFWFLLRDDQDIFYSSLLGGVLLWFSVHMFAEGYVLAGGSFLCFVLWLTIGAVTAYKKEIDKDNVQIMIEDEKTI